jgi:hypothetical protein
VSLYCQRKFRTSHPWFSILLFSSVQETCNWFKNLYSNLSKLIFNGISSTYIEGLYKKEFLNKKKERASKARGVTQAVRVPALSSNPVPPKKEKEREEDPLILMLSSRMCFSHQTLSCLWELLKEITARFDYWEEMQLFLVMDLFLFNLMDSELYNHIFFT